MSLFNPSAPFVAFPAPLDVPINQPALGDNVAWNTQGEQTYDHWTFDSGYDDSWAWEDRKEDVWNDYESQSKSILISVKPTTKDGEQSNESGQSRARRKSKSQHPDASHSRTATASQPWDENLYAEPHWLQDAALDLEKQSLDASASDHSSHAVVNPAVSQMEFDFSDPNAFSDAFLFQPLGALDFSAQALAQPEFLQSTAGLSHNNNLENFNDVASHAWLPNEMQPFQPQVFPADFVPQASALPEFEMLVDELKPLFPEARNGESISPSDLNMDTPAVTSPEGASSPSAEDDQDRLVTCATCQKIVKRRKLRDHMRWHSKTRECPTCQKSFTTDKDLRRHEKQHTGDKPFKCEVMGCKYADTGFARMDNLRRHVKKIHGDSSP